MTIVVRGLLGPHLLTRGYGPVVPAGLQVLPPVDADAGTLLAGLGVDPDAGSAIGALGADPDAGSLLTALGVDPDAGSLVTH
jgi:hypothetical protein